MKACYTYGLFAALFTLSACIPAINIGDKCASDSQCGLLQCHPDGYCTQPCNTNAQCPSEDYLCTQGMCQAGDGLSYECQNASECVEQPCATAECHEGSCVYPEILCNTPPEDYCKETNDKYIQYSDGVCDTETSSCIYQAIETLCPDGCLETCHETCKETDCAQNNNQCWENCVCDPESADGECVCSAKVHDNAQTPQCMLSDESEQNDGYCLAGICVGCINNQQCASQTNACTVSECHPTEYFCIDIVEQPNDAEKSGATTYWSLDACADDTPDDCWASTCAFNGIDLALNGCLQSFLSRTGEACTVPNGQNSECLEESGSCDEHGACILNAKADGTICTATNVNGECSTPNATCNNGGCEQTPTHESADTDCPDTDANECTIAQCDGAGACDQNADNVANGTDCPDTDANECTIAQCDGAGACDQNAVNEANGTACPDTNTNDCKIARCNGAGTCDQNAVNEANGTACTMLSTTYLPNASNDPPSPGPGSDTLAGVCEDGTCVSGPSEPHEACEKEGDCKAPLPYCCTVEALEENNGDCGDKNKNSCVACLNDDDCSRGDHGCCEGTCQNNAINCMKPGELGEK